MTRIHRLILHAGPPPTFPAAPRLRGPSGARQRARQRKARLANKLRRMGFQREGRLCAKPFPLACLSSDSFRTSGKNRPPEGRTSRRIPPGHPGRPAAPAGENETYQKGRGGGKPPPYGDGWNFAPFPISDGDACGYYPPLRNDESVRLGISYPFVGNGLDRSAKKDGVTAGGSRPAPTGT